MPRILRQEALEDGLLGLLGGQAQGLQLQQLVPGDLADGGLVDQLGVGTVGGDGGNGLDAGVAHDDGVALDVTEALGVAHHDGVEHLMGLVLRHEREITRPLASWPFSSMRMSLSASCAP